MGSASYITALGPRIMDERKRNKIPQYPQRGTADLVVTGVWEMDGQDGLERSNWDETGKEWVKYGNGMARLAFLLLGRRSLSIKSFFA